MYLNHKLASPNVLCASSYGRVKLGAIHVRGGWVVRVKVAGNGWFKRRGIRVRGGWVVKVTGSGWFGSGVL